MTMLLPNPNSFPNGVHRVTSDNGFNNELIELCVNCQLNNRGSAIFIRACENLFRIY